MLKKGQPQPGYAAHENSPDRFEETFMYLFVFDGKAAEYTQKKDELLQLLSNDDEALKTFLTDVMKKQKLKAKDENDVVELLQSRQEHLSN